jgi:hypothetical protein
LVKIKLKKLRKLKCCKIIKRIYIYIALLALVISGVGLGLLYKSNASVMVTDSKITKIAQKPAQNQTPQKATAPAVSCTSDVNKIFEGTGIKDNPYKIANVDDLICMSELVNTGVAGFSGIDVYYNQTASIDFKGYGTNPMASIGNTTNSFAGNYDGQNHTIDNLIISRTDNNVGIFGSIIRASISNLGAGAHNSITGVDNVGGIVGTTYSASLYNVYNIATINGNNYVAGIVGFAGASSLYSAYNSGDIYGNSNTGSIYSGGGILSATQKFYSYIGTSTSKTNYIPFDYSIANITKNGTGDYADYNYNFYFPSKYNNKTPKTSLNYNVIPNIDTKVTNIYLNDKNEGEFTAYTIPTLLQDNLLSASYTDGTQYYKITIKNELTQTDEYCTSGTDIVLTADEPAKGFMFDRWELIDVFENPTKTTTDSVLKFTVENSDIDASTYYKEIPPTPPVPPTPPTPPVPPTPYVPLDAKVIKVYTPIQKRIGIKQGATIKVPIIAYGATGTDNLFDVKYTVSNKKNIKLQQINNQTINRQFTLTITALKLAKSTIVIKTGNKRLILKLFVTKTKRIPYINIQNKRIKNAKVSINRYNIKTTDSTFIKVYNKNIAQYLLPKYSYNANYIKIDKFGRIYSLNKKINKVTIKVKYYKKVFKVNVHIR